MACIEESYLITADDESSSVSIKQDLFDNIMITLKDANGPISLEVPEELVSKFVYAINRLTNS